MCLEVRGPLVAESTAQGGWYKAVAAMDCLCTPLGKLERVCQLLGVFETVHPRTMNVPRIPSMSHNIHC